MALAPSKSSILAVFRAELAQYAWAADAAKLERFMSAAAETLNGGNAIDRTGHAWKRALEMHGLFSAKDQALKRLHILPE